MKKFIISADTLKPALKKLSQAIHKKTVLPVLTNLLIKVSKKEVELITSDLELTIHFNCECEAVDAPFEFLMPFDFLSKVVGLTGSAPITIELLSAKKARIHGEYDSYDLNSLDKVDDFPKLPALPKQNLITLNGDFITWLNRSMDTISKDEIRPAMLKACLDIQDIGMTLASTDSHVLFTHSFVLESKEKDQLLVSPKVAKALEGFTETEIYWHSKHIAFKSGKITVIATRHEDKYPNYKSIIPSYDANLTINRQSLINALERVCLTGAETNLTIIDLQKEKGSIHFESKDEDMNRVVQVDIPGTYTGPVEKVALNASKLLVMMNQISFDEVQLHIHGKEKAVLISSESDKGYLGLIMPLIINESI